MADFKLSASLKGHEDDVRGVAFAGPQLLTSASRDATVRTWKLTSPSPPQYDDSILSHGSSFVNAITFVPPSPDHPDGLVVSGGKETIIEVRHPGAPPESDAERLLLGHQGNICSLDVCPDEKSRYLVSGSWDSSAKIWDIQKGECTATLEGHELSVWAVLAYDRETVITGSADKQIRIFRPDGKLRKTIKGSSDVVRALCKLPESSSSGAQFASAGNDSIIRLWTLDGTEVAQLHGHENFIYSLAALPNGDLVSASEDRSIRIWRNNQCIQTITHPAISVWTVAVCAENGDIASGASDRIVRVFSRSSERYADAEAIQAFEDSVKQSAIPQQAMPDINKDKLPGPDFLQAKSGTKEGQVQMVRESNGSIGAYQWSMANQQWMNVGTVVDAVGSSGKKTEYMGQDYDYVFDVDIEDGKPALKLPYNLSQNPYDVAQKFIADHELPISYVEQVAGFIVRNTGGSTINQASANNAGTAPEPWGSESRYRPGEISDTKRPDILPQRDYLTITTANFTTIRKKIEELNQQLIFNGQKDISLNPSDIKSLANLFQELQTTTTGPTTSPVLETGISICTRIITQWPASDRIPGLDLLRCLAAATPAITSGAGTSDNIISVLAGPAAAFPPAPTATANTAMLAARALANLFAHPAGRSMAAQHFAPVHELIAPLLRSATSKVPVNRNTHIAAATLAINYAVLFAGDNEVRVNTAAAGKDPVPTLLDDLVILLNDGSVVDSETLYRGLVGVGTLLSDEKGRKEALESVSGGRGAVEGALKRVEKGAKEPRLKACVGEIRALMVGT